MHASPLGHGRWSRQKVTHVPPVWDILLPLAQKGPTEFSVSSERHRESAVSKIAQVSKTASVSHKCPAPFK